MVIDLNANVNKVNNTKPKLIFGLFAFLDDKSIKILKTYLVYKYLQISLKRQQRKQKATIFVYAKVSMFIRAKLLL